ncbi:D-3-phosphoglycerate dehydrogenase [hydrothermal vent metagenome]|uniref:2-oxoglutarate reductase n=1 Tax=hydrothermal vent metagenome TaxID=652676 RepID=A0A3B1CYM4_9ZZZZ
MTDLSYPKHKIKILLLEGIHENAKNAFIKGGFDVELIASSLDEDELCKKIKGVSILGIRSKTNVTKRVLDNADRLMTIGAFCIGTNQIDLEESTKRGIAVFNAPYSNTRSVVELAIAEIIMLMRNLPDKIRAMHEGVWNKSATNSFEIRGKNLGIVGYGNIGSQLSVVAESMGMHVYYFDLEEKLALGNATPCQTLDDLLEVSDIITMHVDGRKENNNIMGASQFKKMRDGVIFMNLGRGHLVDITALKNSIDSGKVRGTAIDVYPKEPKSNNEPFESELKGAKNTILTPHIGGSTLEAQINIGAFVPNNLMRFINKGNTAGSVNFPQLQLPVLEHGHRLIHIHKNTSGLLAQLNNVLAKHKINILGQYLKTNETIGYVITDIHKEYPSEFIDELKSIEGTIKVRVLF